MRLIETLHISSRDGDRRIELLVGDLSAIPAEHAVDAVVVSVYPGHYFGAPGTLVGALSARGLSVEDLAAEREIDLRHLSNCWLSRPIDRPDLHFRQVLCFEPIRVRQRGPTVADQVGDVFRSLFPFTTGEPWISSVALPLLAAGNQGQSPLLMLRAMLDAATHWLAAGLPISVMKIVVFDGNRDLLSDAREIFRSYAKLSRRVAAEPERTTETAYDLFVSYSHADTAAAERLVGLVRQLDPSMRVFVDRAELDAGNAWQQRIFDAIEASDRVVCFYSPEYLESPVCLEEYNIAHMRNREEGGVLIPAYLRTAPRLPSYMRLIQYVDVRENDPDRLADLAQLLVDGVQRRVREADTPTIAPAVAAISQEATSASVTISAATPAELHRIVDVLTSVGRELRFEVRMQQRAVED